MTSTIVPDVMCSIRRWSELIVIFYLFFLATIVLPCFVSGFVSFRSDANVLHHICFKTKLRQNRLLFKDDRNMVILVFMGWYASQMQVSLITEVIRKADRSKVQIEPSFTFGIMDNSGVGLNF